MSRIKILEMIDKPSLGGGQIHLLSLAGNLDKRRFEVLVSAAGGGPLEEETGRAGLEFIPLDFGKRHDRQAISDAAGLIRDEGFDIVHTHGGVAGYSGRQAALRAGTRTILHTLHGIHYLHYRNPFLRRLGIMLERRLAERTDAVIFVSRADFDEGLKHKLAPRDRMRLIRNGVDVSGLTTESVPGRRLEELRTKLRLTAPLVGTVARLHRQKGIPYFLGAAELVHRRRPEVKFVVVGGGPLEAELRRRVARMDVGRSFLFLGERRDAREIMSLFDVFVLPSLWEGLPLVLIEAAALGKPIISSDIDGVREIIRNGETGILVPPGRPGDLGRAVLRLVGDPDAAAALGERAKTDIPPRFALADMVRSTQNLYLELFENKDR